VEASACLVFAVAACRRDGVKMEPETGPEQQPTQEHSRGEEPRGERLRRHAHRTGLYAWAAAVVLLVIVVVALAVANTRHVKVSWVVGSTRQSLVWIILASAILGWLLGIATSVILRVRTRRRS